MPTFVRNLLATFVPIENFKSVPRLRVSGKEFCMPSAPIWIVYRFILFQKDRVEGETYLLGTRRVIQKKCLLEFGTPFQDDLAIPKG